MADERTRVGWCLTTEVGSSVVFDPVSVASLNKQARRPPGFLTCPSVLDWESRTYAIRSPYAFRLRSQGVVDGVPVVQPVYPQTEMSQDALARLLTIQPVSSWRDGDMAVVQLALPYVFLSDRDTWLTQLEPPTPRHGKNWSLIQGRFNVFEWQRPVNWACEWNMTAGDLVVTRGQIISLIAFESGKGSRHDLMRVPMTQDIRNAIDATVGVTSLVRGTSKLFGCQRERRPKRLVP